MLNKTVSDKARQRFFNKQVHMKEWKDSMAGSNEQEVLTIIDQWGYKIDLDYKRQYPVGDRYVIDIAFPYEKVAIEVDGQSHFEKDQRKKDKQRDKFLKWNDWVILRIPQKKFFKNPSFWRYLIHEVVEDRKNVFIKDRQEIYESD